MAKTWFITGCSRGFGRFITEELLYNSTDNVVATARDPNTLKALQEKFSDRLLVTKLDVTNTQDIQNSVRSAIERFGKIDVLVNNAGYGLLGTLEECKMSDIRSIYDTNVFGLMEVTKEVLPHMRNNKSGFIINLSSIAGLVSIPAAGIYNSTKHAVEGISEALALETAYFGIKVTLVEPGPFRTDFLGSSIKFAGYNAEYDQCENVAQTRARFEKVHKENSQAGDPIKAAKIIVDLASQENPPLRILLGNRAVDEAKGKVAMLQESISSNEKLSRSADYDEAS